MAVLNVNIDHAATLRQARGTKEPDPVLAAYLAELAGAEGIVAHLREDRRHIQDRDLIILRETVKTKLNMEMAATAEMRPTVKIRGFALFKKRIFLRKLGENREKSRSLVQNCYYAGGVKD